MTGIATENPIASPSPDPGPSQVEDQGTLLRAPAGGRGETSVDGDQTTGSGSFRANWQAMLASLEAPTTAGSAAGGKGNAAADTARASTPGSLRDGPSAASTHSADRLARLQKLETLKTGMTPSAKDTAESASTASSSRTNGSRTSHLSHGSDTSRASNSSSLETAGLDSVSGLMQPARLLAENARQATRDSGQPASSSDAAFRARALAVPGSTGQSTTLAVSESEANVLARSAATGPNTEAPKSSSALTIAAAGEARLGGNPYGLNPALAVSDPSMNGALDSATVAMSADGLEVGDVASSASSPSAGRKGGAGSNGASDRSAQDRLARSVQPSQHGAGAEAVSGLSSRSSEMAQGGVAHGSPSIGPLAYTFAASGAAPAMPAGSTLGSGPGSSSGNPAASAGEMFSALDSDASASNVTWTHTGAHRAEAGFEDPALGWVGVRADLGGGSVHASLVPGSAEAAQMLGSHLAGLNEYLAERHPGVDAVTVAGYESSSANGQSGSNTPGGNQSFTQQDSSSNANSSNSNAADSPNGWTLDGSSRISRSGEGTVQPAANNLAPPVGTVPAGTSSGSGGSYISVMA